MTLNKSIKEVMVTIMLANDNKWNTKFEYVIAIDTAFYMRLVILLLTPLRKKVHTPRLNTPLHHQSNMTNKPNPRKNGSQFMRVR
jgi:hypothetical protein